MGFIWEGFGTVLGLFSTLLRDFWLFFGRSKSSFCKAWAPDGLQEAFWMDFRSIWVGFGEGFGKILALFFAIFFPFFRISLEPVLHFDSTSHVKVWLILFKFFYVRGLLCAFSLEKQHIFVEPTLHFNQSLTMSGPPRCLAKLRGASQCAGVPLQRG